MHSALYTGRLRHRRFAPRAHQFSYRLFMMYVDLAELDEVFRGRWLWSARRPALAWLRRADYLGDAGAAPRQRGARSRRRAHRRAPARVRSACSRTCAISASASIPVTFYYCFDAADTRVETIVAEITNTPWNERHAYVLADPVTSAGARVLRYRFAKEFHVSPFMPMELNYDWRFGMPGERLAVHMQNLQRRRARVRRHAGSLAPRDRRRLAGARAGGTSLHDRERGRRHLQAGAEAVAQARSLPYPSVEDPAPCR